MNNKFLTSFLIAFVPCVSFAESALYSQLVREKQEKIAELEKCTGTTKGLKIAGISTLGLTTVGIAANIAEASAIKKYDSKITSADKEIEKTQNEIAAKREEIRQREIAAAQSAASQQSMQKNADIAQNTISGNKIKSSGFKTKCEQYGGTYNNNSLYINNIVINVSDGCDFKMSIGLNENCNSMQDVAQSGQVLYVDNTNKRCVFVKQSDAECLKSGNCGKAEQTTKTEGDKKTTTQKGTPKASDSNKNPKTTEPNTPEKQKSKPAESAETTTQKQESKQSESVVQQNKPQSSGSATKKQEVQQTDGQPTQSDKKFMDKYNECLAKGAYGYDIDEGCTCMYGSNEIWDGSKCVPQSSEPKTEEQETKSDKTDELVIYYKKEPYKSKYTATVDGQEFEGSYFGIGFSVSTKDKAALDNLKQKLDQAGYNNYRLVEEH